ncbi:response regulator transcription factor [Enterobacter pasteurii]|uniref:Response regulator transcription factor n=2 Tax=Enterobacter cloacae complex TaxID=354276 RepID=A0A7H8U9F7_ENTCL|nr:MULTISPECIES: response regulator [Enterobacter]MCM7513930.1 response regulator [Enterobacter hormaechei]MBE4853427.1 response regulator transcription factor [Enterobacter pasteurii]MBE4862721.1 response regulator transcription factor [Enterobacter cloacae complex sp. P40C2]MBE4875244.1 response regulator transcription factor [Enterobacter cloacae complex sp. P40C]MCI2292687.1 response regulator [Enterobacter sp. I4]
MEHIVYVVDDDDTVRQSVVGLLESADLRALGFSSAEAFLNHPFEELPSCVILDMQMPTITGFDVADALKASGREIPIIFLTGHGTIPMSVRAIKGGAYEFLTKPVESGALIDSIESALRLAEHNAVRNKEHFALKQRHSSLTPREHEVLTLAISGMLNKQIAAELGVSEITVKVHRRRVMEKMQVRSVAELVRAVERLTKGQPTE